MDKKACFVRKIKKLFFWFFERVQFNWYQKSFLNCAENCLLKWLKHPQLILHFWRFHKRRQENFLYKIFIIYSKTIFGTKFNVEPASNIYLIILKSNLKKSFFPSNFPLETQSKLRPNHHLALYFLQMALYSLLVYFVWSSISN